MNRTRLGGKMSQKKILEKRDEMMRGHVFFARHSKFPSDFTLLNDLFGKFLLLRRVDVDFDFSFFLFFKPFD